MFGIGYENKIQTGKLQMIFSFGINRTKNGWRESWKFHKPSEWSDVILVKMNQPYTIANLENQDREVGSQNAPFFYKITSGHKDSQSLIFHAQIGTEYFMSRICSNVNSQSMNLKCKIQGCPAVAYAHIPKSSGLVKVKGTRSNGKRKVKARLGNGENFFEKLYPVWKLVLNNFWRYFFAAKQYFSFKHP